MRRRHQRKETGGYFRLTLFVNLCCFLDICTHAANPGCRCINFNDEYTTHREYGIFTSPNWPSNYKQFFSDARRGRRIQEDSDERNEIDCLLYSFHAKENEIVELSFDSLDLQKPPVLDDCSSGDFVKLYLDLKPEMKGVGGETAWDVILCGKTLLETQVTHFSRGSLLVLEFHSIRLSSKSIFYSSNSSSSWTASSSAPGSSSSAVTSNSTTTFASFSGFSGSYTFVNKSDFEPDGEPLSGADCDYEFLSISSTSKGGKSRHRSQGKFFSPGFPSPYKKGVRCAYHFMAKYNEKVRVVFQKIDLANHDLSCLDSKDSITVYDGRSSQSPIIAHLCNNNRFVSVISSGPDLYIEFVSGNLVTSSSSSSSPTSFSSSRLEFAQGFQAKYHFYSNFDTTQIAYFDGSKREGTSSVGSMSYRRGSASSDNIPASSSSLPSSPRDSVIQIPGTEPEEDKPSKDETTDFPERWNCDVEISSDSTKNGSIASPNFPGPYPVGVNCLYHFQGSGRERVQLIFSNFDLNVPSERTSSRISSRDCEGMDTVIVLVSVNGNKEKIDNFCGKKMPPQVMSNGPSLRVDFESITVMTKNNSRGFRAEYKFISDFGVVSNAVQDVNRGVCAFVFNSISSRNGSFTSPNFPGLYPRDTECHYLFYGRSSEVVEITFTHFDIEGVPPCTRETASDYLEFSNFKTSDRKIPRYCGLKKPKTIESDGYFFRITFKSNDLFDGTGFQATYQFKSPTDTSDLKMKGTLSASSSPASRLVHNHALLWTVILVVLTCELLSLRIRSNEEIAFLNNL